MKLNAKCLMLLSIVAFALTGCKKTPEELAKEEDAAKRKAVTENINSVYVIPGKGIAHLVDPEKVNEFRDTCFEFKPKEGKAAVKFYQHPTVYNLSVKTKNELEYDLIFENKTATLQLTLEGKLPTENSDTTDVLSAKLRLAISGDAKLKGMGTIDLAYEYLGDRSKDSIKGRFLTLEECEEDLVRDDEIGKQKSTCEGPGCY
ncbi:lipoprotein, tandem type [Leptospira yasudae]|uniref:Lipoprotein, tandem type n=1 Tax=Leptospira yasudae TaxID=2202201 RepID=A0A6N4QPP5_9LEPT|nr:lipoprotein, tandem type [Leptospira yasudae]TGL73784.1 lipoprotein, tandem type [Leptospira yasudae]TGL79368.1 lipoprotein, tandem type [Leptospira yasudae]TGL85285.1 lipoprotein, tandem type [Leptospira yasudae]